MEPHLRWGFRCGPRLYLQAPGTPDEWRWTAERERLFAIEIRVPEDMLAAACARVLADEAAASQLCGLWSVGTSTYYRYLDKGGAWRTEDHNSRDRYNFNVDATTFIDDFMGTHELKVGGEAQLARVGWMVYGKADPVSKCHYNLMLGEDYYYLGLQLAGDGFDRKSSMVPFAQEAGVPILFGGVVVVDARRNLYMNGAILISPQGEIVGAEGWSMRVRLDEASLKQIANVTQGEYFYAGNATDLRKVYESLSSKLVFERRQSEVTALFAAAAALFAVVMLVLEEARKARVRRPG